jgi:hypothetical protein
LFSCLFVLCLQLLPPGLYLSFTQVFCHYALAPLRHLSYRMLTAPFYKRLSSHSRWRGMPPLALIVCLLAVVTKMPGLPNGFKMVPTHSVRKNGCGNCGVSDPVVRNSLHELVVGTLLSLSILSLSL